MNIYIVNAITDEKILPDSAISSDLMGDTISVVGSPGQYIPASFVIEADTGDIISLLAQPHGVGPIPASNVNIRTVKCWYQAGRSIYETNYKILTPELLLNNDSLVKVESQENYLELSTGEIHISDPAGIIGISDYPTVSEFPVRDTDILQPVDIPSGTNKQFWVTVRIPPSASTGTYSGTITLLVGGQNVGTINLNVEVLPINLVKSDMMYSIMYFGILATGEGTVSQFKKNTEQYRVEMRDLARHGIFMPTSGDPFGAQSGMSGLDAALKIRNEMGMGAYPLIYTHWGTLAPEWIGYAKTIAAANGISEIIFFASEFDEPTASGLDELRVLCEMVHGEGAQVFASLSLYTLTKEQIISMADVVDVANVPYDPDPDIAAAYHAHGHKVVSYSNPQGGEEIPETYRRNYGLLLWQKDYDGTINCSYQYNQSSGNVWNDFDGPGAWRDHNFTYPTVNGIISTIEWEGMREGVTDMNYLATLLRTITVAEGAGVDTTAATEYIATLKELNLSNANLDEVRSNIAGHILQLQSELQPPERNWIVPIVVALIIIAIIAMGGKR